MNPGPTAPINTRRRAIASIAAALAAAPLARAQQPSMAEKPSTEANKARTTIH